VQDTSIRAWSEGTHRFPIVHVLEEDADWIADLPMLVRLFLIALTVLCAGSTVNPEKGTAPEDGAADIRCFFIAFAGIFWGNPRASLRGNNPLSPPFLRGISFFSVPLFTCSVAVAVFAWTKEGKNIE